MLYLFLLSIILAMPLYGIRVGDNFNYIARFQTDSIKGFFVLLLTFGHAFLFLYSHNYCTLDNFTYSVVAFYQVLAQLVVVLFLFYSGFGVWENIKTKGYNYVKRIPRRRIFYVLINFDLAVLVYMILSPLTLQDFSYSKVLLYFLAWDNVGNGSWYILVILICYLITYLIGFLLFNYSVKKLYLMGGRFLFSLLLGIYSLNTWTGGTGLQ